MPPFLITNEYRKTPEPREAARCFSCGREINEEGKKKEDIVCARRGEWRRRCKGEPLISFTKHIIPGKCDRNMLKIGKCTSDAYRSVDAKAWKQLSFWSRCDKLTEQNCV